jgi:hypothetical protein
MSVHRAIVIGLALVGLVGCPKKKDEPLVKAEASATATAEADASANLAPDSGATRGPAGASFGGKYAVTAGTMYVPAEKDWSSVKFKNDDSKLLGDGELTLAIDATGGVSGTTEGGPLGAALLGGTSDGQTLTATIRRKDPSDDGLTGTLLAKVTGDKIEGTMKLAEFNAAVVRVGTFTATKK